MIHRPLLRAAFLLAVAGLAGGAPDGERSDRAAEAGARRRRLRRDDAPTSAPPTHAPSSHYPTHEPSSHYPSYSLTVTSPPSTHYPTYSPSSRHPSYSPSSHHPTHAPSVQPSTDPLIPTVSAATALDAAPDRVGGALRILSVHC